MSGLRCTVSIAFFGALFSVVQAASAASLTPPAWAEQFMHGRELCKNGQLAQAEQVYKDLLQSVKGSQAEPAVLSRVYDELAGVLKVSGSLDEAEKDYLRALNILEQQNGHTGDAVGVVLYHLGAFYVESGQLSRAEEYFADSVRLLQKSTAVPDFFRASILQNLAALAYERGHFEEADKNFRTAVEMLRNGTAVDRPQLAIVLGNLAQLLTVEGMAQNALPFLDEATGIFDGMPGKYLPSYYLFLLTKIASYRAMNQIHVAASSCDRALSMGEQVFGPESPKLVPALDACSVVFKADHRGKQAKQLAGRSTLLKAELSAHSSSNQTVDVSTLMRQSAR